MLLNKLKEKLLINPPKFVLTNTIYLATIGSHAYGCADTAVKSKQPDKDMVGICIPPKEYIFPNVIPGFGTKPQGFDQYQEPHILDKECNVEYDFTIYNIVKFFELARQGNPNFLDALFVDETLINHCTNVGRMIRDNRKLFVSKEIWVKFRNYAFSQMKKVRSKVATGSRVEIVKKFGYDVKFFAHCVRLLDEVEQLMKFGEMNLFNAKEMLKSIRRGEWTLEQGEKWFAEKNTQLEAIYSSCKLPDKAPEQEIKSLLLYCLEQQYGSLEKFVRIENVDTIKLKKIEAILNGTAQ